MKKLALFALIFFVFKPQNATAQPGQYFSRVIFVIFENEGYSKAMKQSFFKKLAHQGASFSQMSAITHPSQPNYLALTSASTQNIHSDMIHDIIATNIVDQLEQKNVSWAAYFEDYPGNCSTVKRFKGYVRKHNPFISYLNIQNNELRCANLYNSDQFSEDYKNCHLPEYIFYVPNLRNSGHDSNIEVAGSWYEKVFSQYIADPQLMEETIIVTTFDESNSFFKNKIYTSIVGGPVKPGVVYNNKLNLYSLLRLVEDNWNLKAINDNDRQAEPIPDIWN